MLKEEANDLLLSGKLEKSRPCRQFCSFRFSCIVRKVHHGVFALWVGVDAAAALAVMALKKGLDFFSVPESPHRDMESCGRLSKSKLLSFRLGGVR